jgi:uncharacterized membrane protein
MKQKKTNILWVLVIECTMLKIGSSYKIIVAWTRFFSTRGQRSCASMGLVLGWFFMVLFSFSCFFLGLVGLNYNV